MIETWLGVLAIFMLPMLFVFIGIALKINRYRYWRSQKFGGMYKNISFWDV